MIYRHCFQCCSQIPESPDPLEEDGARACFGVRNYHSSKKLNGSILLLQKALDTRDRWTGALSFCLWLVAGTVLHSRRARNHPNRHARLSKK